MSPILKPRPLEHRDRLSALMLTYPSTHGVFEASVRRICQIVHTHGGQVYIDGANMNARSASAVRATSGRMSAISTCIRRFVFPMEAEGLAWDRSAWHGIWCRFFPDIP